MSVEAREKTQRAGSSLFKAVSLRLQGRGAVVMMVTHRGSFGKDMVVRVPDGRAWETARMILGPARWPGNRREISVLNELCWLC